MSQKLVLVSTATCLIEASVEGPNTVIRKYAIDPAKPKIWREGHLYFFNKELVETKSVMTKSVQTATAQDLLNLLEPAV